MPGPARFLGRPVGSSAVLGHGEEHRHEIGLRDGDRHPYGAVCGRHRGEAGRCAGKCGVLPSLQRPGGRGRTFPESTRPPEQQGVRAPGITPRRRERGRPRRHLRAIPPLGRGHCSSSAQSRRRGTAATVRGVRSAECQSVGPDIPGRTDARPSPATGVTPRASGSLSVRDHTIRAGFGPDASSAPRRRSGHCPTGPTAGARLPDGPAGRRAGDGMCAGRTAGALL